MVAYASGTKAHNTDFNELAGPALVELLKRRPEVKLLLVGYLALDPAFDEVREQIIRFDYVNGAMEFWSLLADADVNLAVLKPTWATDSKSEIKWLEAAVMGIPSIVSETAMYREVLEDGVDALIVRTPEEWLQALGAAGGRRGAAALDRRGRPTQGGGALHGRGQRAAAGGAARAGGRDPPRRAGGGAGSQAAGAAGQRLVPAANDRRRHPRGARQPGRLGALGSDRGDRLRGDGTDYGRAAAASGAGGRLPRSPVIRISTVPGRGEDWRP
jgi:hypothetical protein